MSALLGARGLLNANVNVGIKVPQQVMGSVFYTLNKRWALLGNVGWQQWSKFGAIQLGVDSTDPKSLTTNIPFKSKIRGTARLARNIT
jgi:long-chain fatty acid transport protein